MLPALNEATTFASMCKGSLVRGLIPSLAALFLAENVPNPIIEKVPFDLEIQRNFKQHYSGGKLSDTKRYFATKYIVFKEKRKKSV